MKGKNMKTKLILALSFLALGLGMTTTLNSNVSYAKEVAPYQAVYHSQDSNEAGKIIYVENLTPAKANQNKPKLLNSQETFQDNQTNLDQAEADKVIAFIENLGEISTTSRDAIVEAKKAFEGLTRDQQKLVTNKKVLIKAIEDYNKLIANDEKIKPIEELKEKTIFSSMLENKVSQTILIVTGTIFLVLILYGLYLLFKKIFKKCCK